MKHPIPKAALAQHIIVLGKTRSGKSSKMRVIVEELLEDSHPVCIIDPKGDWFGLRLMADGKHAGYPVVIFGGEHSDVPLNERAGAHVAELIATGNRPSLIDLGGWMVGERTRFFIDFASTFFKLTRGRRYLIIDEVHNFAPQGRVFDPDAGKALHWANRLASEGSGKGVTLIAASQRPQKVSKDFVTSCETLIACRVIHKLDRDAIKDWIDGCADPAKGKEVLQQLATMQREEAWVWSPEIDFGPKRVTFPMFKTYDSFKPHEHSAAKLKGWAEVDLEEVRAKLQTVVAEATANDPKLLRKQIAELQRQLKSRAPAAAPSAAVSHKELQAAEQRGLQRGLAAARETQTALLAAVRKRIDSALSAVHPIETKAPKVSARALEAFRNHASPVEQPRRPQIIPKIIPPASGGNGSASVSAPRQKLLDKLAWLEMHSLYPAPKETLAAVAGVSPTSGGYFNNLSALRSAGFIDYPTPGEVAFTEAGRALANPSDDPRPVHEHWLDVVTKPQRAILEALIAKHPDAIEKNALAEEIGVSPTSGGYFNNLGRLRTLGAIDYPQKGRVALTRHVIP